MRSNEGFIVNNEGKVVKEGDHIDFLPVRSRWKGYDIQVVDIRPGDTILCHINDDVDLESCKAIQHELRETFPENNILLVNEWVLKGMTVIRNAQPVGDSIDELLLDKPLEELYPDLFGNKTSGLKPGEILW